MIQPFTVISKLRWCLLILSLSSVISGTFQQLSIHGLRVTLGKEMSVLLLQDRTIKAQALELSRLRAKCPAPTAPADPTAHL